jgi:pyruvate formate lyase activating enzyme
MQSALQKLPNWEISQMNPERSQAYAMPPDQVVALAVRNECPSIAILHRSGGLLRIRAGYSRLAHEQGVRNILVTAGYVNAGPWKELCAVSDAANIDLKAFSDAFYRENCRATLKPVLDALVIAKSMRVEVEVTNLIIPTLNDSDRMLTDLCRWLKENLGAETPLHFSRFWPNYHMKNLPPTPEDTLLVPGHRACRRTGLCLYRQCGLRRRGNDFCPRCHEKLLDRRGYQIVLNRISGGVCPTCGYAIAGVWP